MLSTFRLADNLVPLFLGVLATILSIVASVPGRLEEHSLIPWLFVFFILIMPINGIFNILNTPQIQPIIWLDLFLIFPFLLFAGYDIYRIVFRDRQDKQRIQLSGIISFFVVMITILSIQFGIPAKLCFYTHQNLFQQVLERQILNSEYKNIKKIGSIEIEDIIVTNSYYLWERLSRRENDRDKDVYFVTGNTSIWSERSTYGFVYSASNLESIHEDLRPNFTHINGKWYIFSNK